MRRPLTHNPSEHRADGVTSVIAQASIVSKAARRSPALDGLWADHSYSLDGYGRFWPSSPMGDTFSCTSLRGDYAEASRSIHPSRGGFSTDLKWAAAVRSICLRPALCLRVVGGPLGLRLDTRVARVSLVPPTTAVAWPGAALKRLRVEAGISPDALAVALDSSVAGLRVVEVLQHVTVRIARKYREALNVVASPLEVIEPIKPTKHIRPVRITRAKPDAMAVDADQVRAAVLALSRPGEIFEASDVAGYLEVPVDEVAAVLKLMTAMGELRNATAWNRAVRVYAPSRGRTR